MEGTKMAIASSDASTSAPAAHTAAASGATAVAASASSSWSGVAIPTLDAAILVSGVLGHALVVVILSCKRRKGLSGSRTDVLLLSLSVADLTQLACLPFNSASIVLHEWIFGAALCKLFSFLATACTSASVFTLTVLSLNRYVTVAHVSWAYRLSRSWATHVTMLTCIWLPALVIALPQPIYNKLHVEPLYCLAIHMVDNGSSHIAYASVLFVSCFVLPLLIISFAYCRLVCYVNKRRRSPSCELRASRGPAFDNYNQRLTVTVVLLVVAFVVCWLPSYVVMYLTALGKQSQLNFGTFMLARLMSLTSLVINPFIYAFLSRQFRRDLREVFESGARCWVSRGNDARVNPCPCADICGDIA
ncbi:galanin receptor type 1-like [Lethenteron reissneri]|uniref:galanin receptor type 1-like n=1 Tax=Lethenteron reissneri TaxID=7753 RepID=UPI002AB648CC|nr:galanin receptor type 1-like [Lethenteron reissneri]